jgi:hypothetical protein
MLCGKVNPFCSVLSIRKELFIVALQSPGRINCSNIVMRMVYLDISLMSFSR